MSGHFRRVMTFGMAVAPSFFLEVDPHLHTSSTHLDTNTTHNRAMSATLSRLPPIVTRRAKLIKSKLRRTPKPVPAVVTHALSIVEILEAILFEVDHRTLLVACQRVNRSWKATIDHSHLLQQWLFFRPTRMLQAYDYYDDGRCPCLVNPLLQFAFPGWLDIGIKKELTTEERFHPLLCRRNPDAWRRKEASWRRMEVTQPPTRRLNVELKLPLHDSYLIYMNHGDPITFPQGDGSGSGLLMGSLYDYIVEMALRRVFDCPEICASKARCKELNTSSWHIWFPYQYSDPNEEWMEVSFEREFGSDFSRLLPTFESEGAQVPLEASLEFIRWTIKYW
jgi:hypothetical protein